MKYCVAAVLAVLAASVAAGCGGGSPHALYSYGGWGESTSRDPIGKRFSFRGIPLCTRGRDPVTITSIEPAAVSGQMDVDRFLAARNSPDTPNGLAIYPGKPPGTRPAAGLTIPAPTACSLSGTGRRWIPHYELIVMAHRTGAYYGSVHGFRVHYRVGNARGVYLIDVTFCLDGKGEPDSTC